MHRSEFFELCWKQYTKVTPQAQKIQSLLQTRGDIVRNDHVAFRTFNIAGYIDERHEHSRSAQNIGPALLDAPCQCLDRYHQDLNIE